MNYLNKFISLKERASAQVAINLCQGNSFKELALNLRKPIHGLYVHERSFSFFISDPVVLSIWTKINEAHMEKEDQSNKNLMILFYNFFNEANQWDTAIHEQCQSLTKWLPKSLKQGVSIWIGRIALEYLSFSRRQESLFGISRYFLMDILTQPDWMEDCKLDEEKIAKRFVQDERLTILQRFRVACFYCLYTTVPALWMRLTPGEKRSFVRRHSSNHLPEITPLLLAWSRYITAYKNRNIIEPQSYVWTLAAQEAAHQGNRSILKSCWNRVGEPVKRQLVFDLAFESLRHWYHIYSDTWIEHLFSNELFEMVTESSEHFKLPSYYSEVVRFLLSEMSKVEQFNFFKKAFQTMHLDYVLECLLDWPHHKEFLPTVHQLWEIIPKEEYGQCLLAVAKKYSAYCESNSSVLLSEENHYYDYRSLLEKLWEETPEEYKRFLFSDDESEMYLAFASLRIFKHELFCHLLDKSPFQEKDEALFRQIWSDLLPEQKTELMHSETGEVICLMCIINEKWSFLNRLIEDCIPEEEIPVFKKKFISSSSGQRLCLYKLKTREKLLEDLSSLPLELYYEKLFFGCELIDKKEFLEVFELTLNENELTDEYCVKSCSILSCNKTEQFNFNLLKYVCRTLLKDCAWMQMNDLLAWSFDTEEEIMDFKRYLFSCKGTYVHYKLVFILRQWNAVECFYKWFCLSPEEIVNLKKETIMIPEVIKDIHKALFKETNTLVESLSWCLTNEAMVLSLKEEVEEHFKENLDKDEKAKERLDSLVSELLSGFEIKIETMNAFGENKGEKRLPAIKDESSLSNKLFKKSF